MEAVLDELAAGGYGRLSMQRVAARAGVGKSALYRRWSGRHEMVMDVVARLGSHEGEPPDTGSLAGDLRELLLEMRSWLAHPRLAQILPDLLAESRRSEDLAEALWSRLAAPRRAWSLAVLERARARGEIAEAGDSVASELITDIVGSVPFWRSTVHGADIDDECVERLAAMLACGLGSR